MYGHPPDGRGVRVAIGHQLLQLQRSPANETEGGAHGAGAVHVPLPQRPEGVGVVEGDPTFLKVKAHAQPGGQGVGDARRRRVAGAVGHGVPGAVAMVTVVVAAAVLGEVDFAHAHGEEAEGGGVLAVLGPAVVAAVWVAPADREPRWTRGTHCWSVSRVSTALKFSLIKPVFQFKCRICL